MISFLTIDLYHKHKNHSALIGKREISPQLCCGDEWRVEFEAVVSRFSIPACAKALAGRQKNSRVPPSPSFAVRVLLWHGKQKYAFV